MEKIDSIIEKLRSGSELTYEEFDALRGYQESIDDGLEILSGRRDGIREIDLRARSKSAGFAIVVGHTKTAPGASGVKPVGQSEYPWNKDLASKIKSACVQLGVESKIFYRDGVGISGAYKLVSQWGAGCVVELHFNAFNGTATGTETLYDNDKNGGSKAWATLLQNGMLNVLGLKDRKLKECDPGDRGYGSVSALDIPSALIEPFFGDNSSDATVAENNKDDLAMVIAKAAASQLKIS